MFNGSIAVSKTVGRGSNPWRDAKHKGTGMIRVGDMVQVLDANGQPYFKIADRGRVTRVTDTEVDVRISLYRSPDYFALTFPVNRVRLVK